MAEMARLQPHHLSAIQQQQQAWDTADGLPSTNNASIHFQLEAHLAFAKDLEQDSIAAFEWIAADFGTPSMDSAVLDLLNSAGIIYT